MSGAGKRRRRGGGRTRPNNEGNGNENPQSNAQFDGTSGPGGAGQRPGVNSPPRSPRAGSPPSRGRSPAPATPTIGSIGQVMQGSNLPLRDPARDPERASRITDMCRNIDLPADAYLLNPEVSIFLRLVAGVTLP
ncbi:eukaryotic translation initiation factor 2c [Histoplasma capsulatum]|uniref:Eukaryotic translation initiation factor 2c n=1 Tax=Ajellomyces capsulatus TaxID=5037 RepID=A0A8A1MJU7_AJECA|nr:eukaryotic translation initiation factor 2c [Histoplasma capsulatum]